LFLALTSFFQTTLDSVDSLATKAAGVFEVWVNSTYDENHVVLGMLEISIERDPLHWAICTTEEQKRKRRTDSQPIGVSFEGHLLAAKDACLLISRGDNSVRAMLLRPFTAHYGDKGNKGDDGASIVEFDGMLIGLDRGQPYSAPVFIRRWNDHVDRLRERLDIIPMSEAPAPVRKRLLT
jgi:hypothetical protein